MDTHHVSRARQLSLGLVSLINRGVSRRTQGTTAAVLVSAVLLTAACTGAGAETPPAQSPAAPDSSSTREATADRKDIAAAHGNGSGDGSQEE
jgi:hypothetical protein